MTFFDFVSRAVYVGLRAYFVHGEVCRPLASLMCERKCWAALGFIRCKELVLTDVVDVVSIACCSN